MSKRRTQATIPEPYTDVVSLRTSVMAIKELVEDLAGQRGDQDTTAVTWDDLGAALGTGVGSKVSKAGDTMTGSLIVNGDITANQNFRSSTANVVLAGVNGGVYLRPIAAGDGSAQLLVTANGACTLTGAGGNFVPSVGFICKGGAAGATTGNVFNLRWNQVSATELWIDNSMMGGISVSDYRIKDNVADLPGMWDTVKALRPISYTIKDYGTLSRASDEPQWGFVAHELQETLLPSAATGEKDAENVLQAPYWAPVVAALTKALQEAMARIEALEANG